MSDDIVTRLRAVLHDDRSVELMNREAADKIERLRSDLSIFRGVAHELDRIRGQLREAAETIERLYTEIDRLRAERDEIRLSYCSLMEAYRGGDGRVTANKLGWGYLFAEDSK